MPGWLKGFFRCYVTQQFHESTGQARSAFHISDFSTVMSVTSLDRVNVERVSMSGRI